MTQKYKHYYLGALGLTILALGSAYGYYNYLYFSIHDAYNRKKDIDLAHLVQQYQNIFPNSYKLIFQLSLEKRIQDEISNSAKTLVDPTLDPFSFNLSYYIDEKRKNTSSEKWIQFYRELESYSGINGFEKFDDFNVVTTINCYHQLAEKASQLNFRYKSFYLNSCYNYDLFYSISRIPDVVKDYIQYNTTHFFDDEDITFDEWCKLKTESINTAIQVLNKINNKPITIKYYEEIEKVFYNSITTLHTYHDKLRTPHDQENVRELNKDLFSSMKLYSSNRLPSFPRSQKEIKQYTSLEQLILSYE